MDKGWNRLNEKNYRQPSSGGHQQSNQLNPQHYYRKKNDFSGPDYYSKTTKPNAKK